MFILTKPDLLTTKSILYNESIQILEKSIFHRAALWRENRTETESFALPHVTFCKHCKDRLSNYE